LSQEGKLDFKLKLDWGLFLVTSMMTSVQEDFVAYNEHATTKNLNRVKNSSTILRRLLLTEVIQPIDSRNKEM